MAKLLELKMINFCGFRDTTINFRNKSNPKQWAILFAPNGAGKTSVIQAIKLITTAYRYQNRDCSLALNKYCFSQDYSPTAQVYKSKLSKMMQENKDNPLYKDLKDSHYKTNKMHLQGTFLQGDEQKKVIISNQGTVLNELGSNNDKGWSYFIDADHPMENQKFQIQAGQFSDIFITLCEEILGYKTYFTKSVNVSKDQKYFTDVTIEKFNTRVSFKQMSAGEKKAICLLKSLCNDKIYNNDIILVDNIQLHLYWSKHHKLFEILKTIFANHQFIVTTHSGTLIKYIEEKYNSLYLYDIQKYKIQEMKKIGIENPNFGN